MKNITLAALLSIAAVTPAWAADQSAPSFGAAYGFDYDGVISIYGDFDISDMANNAPVKARFGLDFFSPNYSSGGSTYTMSTNRFYGAAYYDFSKHLTLDKRVHPFAGLGLFMGSSSCSGAVCGSVSSPTNNGLYFIAGVQFDAAPKIALEANVNETGGLTIGANFKF